MAEFGPPEITDINAEIRRKTRIRLPGQKRAAPAHPPLPPEEQKSVLREVGNLGIGGLQYIGETLDKPGRMVRGLATGNYRELGNLVPFSDTIGLTDPGKATSGKDLLQHYGLQEKGAEGIGASAAGLGAEILTDPLSYLSLGASAVGKAGKVGKAVGISVKGAERGRTLASALKGAPLSQVQDAVRAAKAQGTTLHAIKGEQMGGAFGLTTGPLGLLGLHGTHVPEFAKTPTAFKATKAVADLPEKLTRSVPFVGNAIADTAGKANLARKALFSNKAMGQWTPEGQLAGEYATNSRKPALARASLAAADSADAIRDVAANYHQAFGHTLGTKPEETEALIRRVADLAAQKQTRTGAPNVRRALGELMPGIPVRKDLRDELQAAVAQLHKQKDSIYAAGAAKGLNHKTLFESIGEAPVAHYPGYFEPARTGVASQSRGRILKKDFGNALRRTPEIAYVDKNALNKMMEDPQLLGSLTNASSTSPHSVLGSRYKQSLIEAAQAATQKNKELYDALPAAAKLKAAPPQKVMASNIADGLIDWLNKGHQGRFREDAVENLTQYLGHAHVVDANADAIHHMLHANQGGAVPLAAAFKNIGFTPEAMNYFGKRFGINPAAVSVTPEAAAAAKAFMEFHPRSETVQKILDIADMVTQPFKKNVTLPFLSFATRNFFSGQAMNFMGGDINSAQDAVKYFKSVMLSHEMMKHPDRYQREIRMAIAHDAIPKDWESLGVELGGSIKQHVPNPVTIKGMGQNVRQGFQEAKDIAFNPDSIAAGAPKSFKAFRTGAALPAQIGGQVNKQIEFLNRMSQFNYLTNHKGYAPAVAASKTRQLQVAYDELAPFEKDFMRRIAPFYTYARKTVPEMFRQIGERPGGVTAQIVRGSNTGRSENEFVPPYVGEGMSVKLGPDKYLSQLGLPTDQFSDLFAKGPTALGTLKRTGQKALAMTNPIVKGPLEVATGQNFFTGRPLAESYPHPTNNQLANQVLHNTPLSRAFTTARQLDDDRKDWLTKSANLATGLRITDVSGGIEKQQRIAESKILQEMLREDPNIATSVDVYPKKDQKTGKPKELTPESERLYRAFLGIKRQAAEEAKKRKKELSVSAKAE